MKMENQQKPKIRNGITKDFFLRDVVNMTSKSWQEYCIDQACSKVDEWRVKELNAYANQHPSIAKNIEHVSFPQLTYLNIWGNNIVSIEGLMRTRMPVLEKLWIWQNNIVSLRELKKIHWQSFHGLDAKNNPLIDYSAIEWLPCKSITRLHLSRVMSIGCFFKLKTNQISDPSLPGKRFIGKKTQKALQNKFRNPDLLYD